jgi:hypothetical protein
MRARLIEVGWLTTLRSNREAIIAEINTLELRFMQRSDFIQQFCWLFLHIF